MRRPSREINVLSVAAIDLFCSAFGAFIIICLVMMPYFGNTSKTPPTTDVNLPQADVMVLIDTSGSMTDQIDGLKAEVGDLAKVLTSLAGDARLGIIDFDDQCASPSTRMFPLKTVSPTTILELEAFAGQMEAGMPCTAEANTPYFEALDAALQQAAGMDWKASRRFIIVISDNGVYPGAEQSALGITRRFKGEGGKLSVMFVRSELGNHPSSEPLLRALAEAGGGSFNDLNGRSFGMQVLLAMTE